MAAPVRLKLLDQLVVVCVAADPEPDDLIAAQDADGSVIDGDASGIDRFDCMDALELQAGIVRVPFELLISLPCLASDRIGQGG